jgi:hypothetical protein
MTGYVWAENMPSDAHPNIRKPKKGTRYDDLHNALEYVVIGEKLGAPLTERDRENEKRRLQRVGAARGSELRAQNGTMTLGEMMAWMAEQNRRNRDDDPADPLHGRGRYRSRVGMRRGGCRPTYVQHLNRAWAPARGERT